MTPDKSSKVAGPLAFLLVAALLGSTALTPASAQDQPADQNKSTAAPIAPDGSKVRESFRSKLQGQQKTLEQSGRDVATVVDKLKGLTATTVESRIVEVRALRDALVRLGAQLQPDAPLAQGVDQYQSWLSAQVARLNNQRATLGPEFVQDVIGKYQAYLNEVTRGRESIANNSNAIDRALKELTTAEMRAGELLLAEDASTAVKELVGVLQTVGKTVDDIRRTLREIGTAGV